MLCGIQSTIALSRGPDSLTNQYPDTVCIRDAIFRKMTNQNQTDTNAMATTETKYQTDFYSAQKYQYLTKF